MIRRIACVSLLLTLSQFAFSAEPADVAGITEQPIETHTSVLVLPRTLPGSLAVRPCDSCAPLSLRIDDSSRFFLTRTPVSVDEFRQFTQTTRTDAVVLFDPNSRVVTRIIASAQR